MSTDSLKNFERDLRARSAAHEGREPLSEDRITLLVIRQLVAEYQLRAEERRGELDDLIKDGESEGSLAYDEAQTEIETAEAEDLYLLFDALTQRLP
ncbi:hypothetical protein SEA_HANK144_64 [Streptomyces phage Hank144]|uniref:Uncharacterized protein n=1 Tax=Streptomyces phage Hank144 TaxID=2301573 RepID=A0A385DQJ6_9CAUD|nr:hypothetical protein KGG76_gp64 [Streptomyces phage Hank144]AXQ61117.1 hypothetical protein SEA_HANK144_64 [Streptomyces phage Hank144]